MLKIIYSRTNKDSAEYLLKSLKGRDKTQKHIVFTPDRANLIYQNRIFDLINEECLFDVDVTTISRFASRFANDEKVLSKQGGVAIVKKILIEKQNEFLSFGKSVKYKGFALSLFETLCMFKSCRIAPENIMETKNGVLNNKLHDIKIVYQEYEKFLQSDYTDAFNILTLCASKINKSFSDTNFYFVGFEDFTKQGFFLIEKMMKYANNVFVGTAYGKKGLNNNFNIYDNAIVSALIDIAKTNGVKYDMVVAKCDDGGLQNVLKNNLFAFALKHGNESQDIKVFSYDNRIDEVKNTINYIRYQVQKNNLRYSDFTILVPSIKSYKTQLKQVFSEFNMPFYLDESQNFGDNLLARYVMSIVKIVDDYSEIFNIIKTPFVDIEESKINDYLDRVEKFGLIGKSLLDCDEIQCERLKLLKEYIDKSRKVKTIGGYIDVLRDAIENFAFSSLDAYQNALYDRGLIEEYKKVPQCVNILTRTLDQVDDILHDYECTHKNFVEIIENYVENINLTLPPVVVDSVFVGEIETSFVQDTKYLFVLGCNEGVVPAYSSELGLISDKEIGQMPQNYRLNPTIAEINKRKKFKVFENLVSFENKIYLSFLTTSDGGKAFPSSFIEDVQILFDAKIIDGSLWLHNTYSNLDGLNESLVEFDNLSQACVDYNFAKQLKNYDFLKENKGYIEYLSLLSKLADKSVLEGHNFKNDIKNISEELFLISGQIGVSEIERYNSCPYKHFVEYGLKLRDKKRSNFEAVDNGQIIHEFLKLIVPKITKKQDVDINEMTQSILSEVLNRSEYQHLVNNEINKVNVKALYNECVRIVEGVKYQLDNSSFSPIRFEQPFKYSVGGVSVGNKDIILVGVVDRIDAYKDRFTIIDYKTGSTKMESFDEVQSGEKWQLIVYMYVVGKGDLKPAGCYYMPIKNDFTTKEKYSYQLQGITNKDRDVISALDNNLDKQNHSSKLLKLETSDKGLKKNSYYKNMCLNDDEMSALNLWVMDNVQIKIKEILSGNVKPYPLMSGGRCACDYCKYIGLCNFNKAYGNAFNISKKCKNLSELLSEVDE